MDCFVASLPCANALRLSQAMTKYLGSIDGSLGPLDAWLRRAADLENIAADDVRAGARDFRRRAAGPRRAERRVDPAAADFHDGPDLGDRDAVLHLLGR